MKASDIHLFDHEGNSALTPAYLVAEIERLQRENARLKRLMLFRARKMNPKPAPIVEQTKH